MRSLLVLLPMCLVAGAGHVAAQGYRDLTEAVTDLTTRLAANDRLRGKNVLVNAHDFFEEGTKLNLPLSATLRERFSTELSDRGVRVFVVPEGSEDDMVIFQGTWRVLPQEPDVASRSRRIHLTVKLIERTTDGHRISSADGRITGVDESYLTPDLASWGRHVVKELESRLRDRRSRTIQVGDLSIRGNVADPGQLREYLEAFWLEPAFAQSRMFHLVAGSTGASQIDGAMKILGVVGSQSVRISLKVVDNDGRLATSASIEMQKALLQDVLGLGGNGGIEWGNLSPIARRLRNVLNREFSPDASNDEGWTDLHYAAVLNLPELALCLLDEGAFVGSRTRSDAGSFSDELQQTLLTFGHDLVNFGWTPDNRTPLHWAVIKRASEVIDVLLDNDANVNAADFSRNTPLHGAAFVRSPEIAAKLIRGGARVDSFNFRGDTPLHRAVNNNAYGVADALIRNGANVNTRNVDGETPLHNVDDADMARLLIRNGADVDAKNSDGETRLCKTFTERGETPMSDELESLLISSGATRCSSAGGQGNVIRGI